MQKKPTLNITQEPVLSSSQKPWQIPVLYSLSPDGMKVTDNRIYLTLISNPRPTLTSQRSRRKPRERQPSARSPDTARGCHFPSLSPHHIRLPSVPHIDFASPVPGCLSVLSPLPGRLFLLLFVGSSPSHY